MKPRKDVLRNQAAILEAADMVFGVGGANVSTEDVAERAGVGIATVFRHFPTKADLIRAVIRTRLDVLISEAESLIREDGDIFDFIQLISIAMAKKRLLSDALRDQERVEAPQDLQARLWTIAEILLRRSQDSGRVRIDVDATDVRAIVAGISGALAVVGNDRDRLDRLLEMTSVSLRTPGTLSR